MAPALCRPAFACSKLGFPVIQGSFCFLRLRNCRSHNLSLSVGLRGSFYSCTPSIVSSSLPLWSSQHCRESLAVLSRIKERSRKVAAGRCGFWKLCKERTGCKLSGFKFNAQSSRNLSRLLFVYAKGDDSTPSEMSFENALKLLGVEEKASFDEILRAKKALVESSAGDEKLVSQVEAAYDALLMQRLMKRRAGEVVDGSVLYADVKTPKANVGSSGVNWLRGALNSVPIIVETPSLRILGTQTAIYSVLMALTYANGLVSSTGSSFQDTRADAPGLILAIGFGASLLFLRKQRLTLGSPVG
ncbi:hypothetical protein O6H91_08G006600 [Diphasiastrum complanatum]|uniref:Uncharacterized protein n=1 Tax=Diphasiastrum complanatum TaxID=34168 RepID=A0ACC2CUI2_DIPCM|nr:hypothetical protein O6H91_08G006600 [Diphasiastrum complanatum]